MNEDVRFLRHGIDRNAALSCSNDSQHSEKALTRASYSKLSASKTELWLVSQGQIDFYDDPRLIGTASDAVAGFFGL